MPSFQVPKPGTIGPFKPAQFVPAEVISGGSELDELLSSMKSTSQSPTTSGSTSTSTEAQLPSWLSPTFLNRYIGELIGAHKGTKKAYNVDDVIASIESAGEMNFGLSKQAAGNVAAEYETQSRQSGGFIPGSSAAIKAQALLPALQQRLGTKALAAETKSNAAQKAFESKAALANAIANARLAYADQLARFKTTESATNLDRDKFIATLQNQREQFGRQLALEYEGLELDADYKDRALTLQELGTQADVASKLPMATGFYTDNLDVPTDPRSAREKELAKRYQNMLRNLLGF